MEDIKWLKNPYKTKDITSPLTKQLGVDTFQNTKNFHALLPNYKTTPLYRLKHLAQHLDLADITIKDESKRFNLNAFKSLGATFAMANYFQIQLDIDFKDMNFDMLLDKIQAKQKTTFATVTAGNHGKGVAFAANLFKQKAKVVLPAGSSIERLNAIKDLGAEAHISDLNYDDAVEKMAQDAKENGWILLQDTAWSGYEEIPFDIMKGYTTIVAEIIEQLDESVDQFSHVILQAGVGSFSAAMAASIVEARKENAPTFILAEPNKAACLFLSAKNDQGKPTRVHGDLDSMMAGLACGEPNPTAWKILKPLTHSFFSCHDDISAIGMRILAKPLGDDQPITSGESGALPLGLLHEIMTRDNMKNIREDLHLNSKSKVLIINTEGDTNPENYKQIIS